MNIFKNKKRKSLKSKGKHRLVLVLLIIFSILSIIVSVTVKLNDLGYKNVDEVTAEISKKTDIINAYKIEPEKETEDFSGVISEIDENKKTILVKIIEPEELEDAKMSFRIKANTEIILEKGEEEILFEDLLVDDPITLSAISARGDRWDAQKIEIEPIEMFSGKVLEVDGRDLLVSRKFTNPEAPEMNYEVRIDTRTKIIIKDYAEAFDENGVLNEDEIVEKVGYLINIKKGSDLIVYDKLGNIPRKEDSIEASNVDIILNSQ